MHWVDRGPEPGSLEPIRSAYTLKWVQYYRDGVGTKPTDSRWRKFHADLRQVFHGFCAYCEELGKGEVDHFRPKSKFPDLVYHWSNWLFTCHDCNNAKGEKWPIGGYIDPCAKSVSDHPEYYFTFDTLTGEILPMKGLSSTRRQKAQEMIEDLQLNRGHHLRERQGQLKMLSALEIHFPSTITEFEEFRNLLRSPGTRLPQHHKGLAIRARVSTDQLMFNHPML